MFDPLLTLNDLLTAETNSTTVFQSLVNNLKTAGFPVTDWIDGGIALTILQGDAIQIANSNQIISDVAAAGFIDLAPGNAPGAEVTDQTWLDLCGGSDFDEDRIAGVFGQYEVALTTASGFGPNTIAPNGLYFTDPSGTYRYQSTNSAPITITSAGATNIVVQAEQAGTGYNTIASPSTALIFITPLLGVSAQTVLAPGSSSTSAVVAGSDIESDANYRARCKAKWGALTVASVDASMTFYAESVVSSHGTVTNVLINDTNPRGPGTVDIYVADDGAPSSDLVTDVDAVLQLKKPLTSDLRVIGATATPIIVTAGCYVPAVITSAAYTAAVNSALAALQDSLVIGDGSGAGTLYFSAVEQLLMNAGARNVNLSVPSVDTVPTLGHIITLSSSLTIFPV